MAWERQKPEPQPTYTAEPRSPRRRKSPRPRGQKGAGKQAPAGTPQPTQPKGHAKGTGGKGDTASSAPDLSQLPVMPQFRVPAPPKPVSENAASEDRRILDTLMAQLTSSGIPLTPEVDALVTQYRSENVQLHGKKLHHLVAKQTQARKELSRLSSERQTFEKTWCDYLNKLVTLVQTQVEQRQKTLEAFEASEDGWRRQLSEATTQLAQSTGGKASVDASAMEEDDEFVDLEIEREAERKQAQEDTAAKFESLMQSLQTAQQQAAQAVTREGSRTPRRRAKVEKVDVDSSPEPSAEAFANASKSALPVPALPKDAAGKTKQPPS